MKMRVHAAFSVGPGSFRRPPLTESRNPRNRCSSLGQKASAVVCVAKSLGDAISEGFVKDFGHTIQLDADGCFPTQNDLELLPSLQIPIQLVLKSLLQSLRAEFLRAVYVRGSVATGNYLPGGQSDLDLVILTERRVSAAKRREVNSAVSFLARKVMRLSAADIRYVDAEKSTDLKLLNGTDTLIRNYAVLVYQASYGVDTTNTPEKPSCSQALNIRFDERAFLRLFNKGKEDRNPQLQLDAVGWICKKCLRAIADLSSQETKRHSRDLLPCYKLGSQAFPLHKDLMLLALQMACAPANASFLRLYEKALLEEGYVVGRRMVEVVEDLALRRKFGGVNLSVDDFSLAPAASVSQFPLVDILRSSVRKKIRSMISSASPYSIGNEITEFMRAELPRVHIVPSCHVNYVVVQGDSEGFSGSSKTLTSLLTRQTAPIVFRNASRLSSRHLAGQGTAKFLHDIISSYESLDCRLSPINTFDFCRGSHAWIEEGRFSPPSKAVTLPSREAICRLLTECPFPPLFYTKAPREHVYIQTDASCDHQIFDRQCLNDLRVAQKERLWISTHGSVSSLHFDASHSVLFQRIGSKRMIFFPPACLEHMGVYPFGHPLHRRARVSLTWQDTSLFENFWRNCPQKAVEVVLEPGDMVVFPPFWSHYTESMVHSRSDLSVSHTMRYL